VRKAYEVPGEKKGTLVPGVGSVTERSEVEEDFLKGQVGQLCLSSRPSWKGVGNDLCLVPELGEGGVEIDQGDKVLRLVAQQRA
jgi:hypothetical protein